MLGLHRRSRKLAALLVVAGAICGCAKDESMVDDTPSAQLGGRLEPGVEVPVRLWGEPADYTYEGTAGEVIDVSVESRTKGLDPNVRLLDPSAAQEAFDDDGGANGDALIRGHVLQSSGDYTVRIESDENRRGEVAVLLSTGGNVEGAAGAPLGTDLP